MNPGRLDRRITVQTSTETRDAGGGPKTTWATFCTLWANKAEGTGDEQVNADKREYINTVVWTCRYRADVTTKMRILDDRGNYYDILGISEVTRRNLMKLTTKTTQ